MFFTWFLINSGNFVWLWDTTNGAQGLILDLLWDIVPGSSWGTMWGAGDWTQVSHMLAVLLLWPLKIFLCWNKCKFSRELCTEEAGSLHSIAQAWSCHEYSCLLFSMPLFSYPWSEHDAIITGLCWKEKWDKSKRPEPHGALRRQY